MQKQQNPWGYYLEYAIASQLRQLSVYPRANGAKRRSGRKPGARVTNFARLFTPGEKAS